TIGRQLFLEGLRPGQQITRLPVLDGASDQGLAGGEDPVAIDEGVVDFKVRALVVAQGKIGYRTKLPLTEVQLPVGGRRLPVEALHQLRDCRLQASPIVNFEDQLPAGRGKNGTIESERDFTAERHGNVVANADPETRLELRQMILEVGIGARG